MDLMLLANLVVVLGATGAVGTAIFAVRRRVRRPAGKRALGVLFAATLTIGGAAAVAELVALWVVDAPLQLQFEQLHAYRPGRFHLKPNEHFSWQTRNPGWKAVAVTTNADGLRTGRPPAPDETGVLFLGDSFTFGIGLDDAETYPAQAERLLAEAEPAHRWCVANAGVPGYNLFSAIDLFEHLAPRYRPRVAVFTINATDDTLPDWNDRLREELAPRFGRLSRFALLRFWETARVARGYEAERALRPLDGGSTPDPLPARAARLDEAGARLGRIARAHDCTLVVYPLDVPRMITGETPDPTLGRLFTVLQAAGASFVFRMWYGPAGAPAPEEYTIPGDGHPSPEGARALAAVVVPAIRAARAAGRDR